MSLLLSLILYLGEETWRTHDFAFQHPDPNEMESLLRIYIDEHHPFFNNVKWNKQYGQYAELQNPQAKQDELLDCC